MKLPDSGWLSVPQACRRLKVNRRALLRLINEGELPAYQMGWMIRLLVSEVDVYRARNPDDGGING